MHPHHRRRNTRTRTRARDANKPLTRFCAHQVLIAFGTESGTSETLAHMLAQHLSSLHPRVVGMDEISACEVCYHSLGCSCSRKHLATHTIVATSIHSLLHTHTHPLLPHHHTHSPIVTSPHPCTHSRITTSIHPLTFTSPRPFAHCHGATPAHSMLHHHIHPSTHCLITTPIRSPTVPGVPVRTHTH